MRKAVLITAVVIVAAVGALLWYNSTRAADDPVAVTVGGESIRYHHLREFIHCGPTGYARVEDNGHGTTVYSCPDDQYDLDIPDPVAIDLIARLPVCPFRTSRGLVCNVVEPSLSIAHADSDGVLTEDELRDWFTREYRKLCKALHEGESEQAIEYDRYGYCRHVWITPVPEPTVMPIPTATPRPPQPTAIPTPRSRVDSHGMQQSDGSNRAGMGQDERYWYSNVGGRCYEYTYNSDAPPKRVSCDAIN